MTELIETTAFLHLCLKSRTALFFCLCPDSSQCGVSFEN
ncbi:hypothetical protein WG78_18810 [Amantichitinum ursilacus]|uniref:Uncharacterized protein n=2 Tax=Amantichitinum ursilacus TaxID=857265 RepID=A0A0N0GLJ0_9NEIS|nr:hypothetical protein WG78_18810 [Amantichitinum ursilacus]